MFWNENNIVKLIDPKILDPFFEKEVVRCVNVGLLSVQEYAADRPNVSAVLSMLSGEITNCLLLNSLHVPEDKVHVLMYPRRWFFRARIF